MPEISRFYGIVIKMFFDDHNPPHFHAQYSGQEAVVDIRTLALISGRLPGRALGLVAEWGLLHQAEFTRRLGQREEPSAPAQDRSPAVEPAARALARGSERDGVS